MADVVLLLRLLVSINFEEHVVNESVHHVLQITLNFLTPFLQVRDVFCTELFQNVVKDLLKFWNDGCVRYLVVGVVRILDALQLRKLFYYFWNLGEKVCTEVYQNFEGITSKVILAACSQQFLLLVLLMVFNNQEYELSLFLSALKLIPNNECKGKASFGY